MAKYICNLVDFTIYRHDIALFKPITLNLDHAKIIELTGTNGIGKTTLLEFIRYRNLKFTGNFEINYKPFYLSTKQPFDTNESVKINVQFWQALYQCSDDIINKALNFWCLEKLLHTKVKYLSCGQIQRLNILRLSLVNNKLLLLDEPTVFLDCSGQELVKKYLQILIKQKKSIIIASNSLLNIGEKLLLEY